VPGVRFLIGDNGNVCAVPSDMDVVLHGTAQELMEFLKGFIEDMEDR